ncbi:hypothetical protein ABBS62_03160 [Bacillus subtilis subsp. subtilis]
MLKIDQKEQNGFKNLKIQKTKLFTCGWFSHTMAKRQDKKGSKGEKNVSGFI